MTESCDSLESNKFYQLLQTTFKNNFLQAQKNCHLICVPQNSSLAEFDINQQFVDLHILRPSPFFIGQYITTDKGSTGCVSLEDCLISTKEGFRNQINVRILEEELAYNAEGKKFRLLIVERPFIEIKKKSTTASSHVQQDLIDLEPSFERCVEYLGRFSECNKVMKSLKEEVRRLQETYMMVPGYMDEVSQYLREEWDSLSKNFIESLMHPAAHVQKIHQNVQLSIESFLLSSLYHKLYPTIQQQHRTEDLSFDEKLTKLKPLSPGYLGIRQEYQCSLFNAVAEVKNLKDSRTPAEMLLCITATLDIITSSVTSHVLQTSQETKDLPRLTSDDYIPLLLCVLCQTKGLCIASVIYYVHHFHWASNFSDQVSFSFVTFQAVAQYIGTLNVDQLVSKHESQASKQETISISKSPKFDNMKGSADGRIDRQIQSLTKKLEVSTREFETVSKDVKPVIRKGQHNLQNKQANAPLGDFLSSLKDDPVCGSSYGKQT